MSIDYSIFKFSKDIKSKAKKVHTLKNKTSELAKMERNRTSILTDDMETCFICKKQASSIHEIFRGRNRQKSMLYGLVVPLCNTCHTLVDNDKYASELLLERQAKEIFTQKYSKEKFIEEFK